MKLVVDINHYFVTMHNELKLKKVPPKKETLDLIVVSEAATFGIM